MEAEQVLIVASERADASIGQSLSDQLTGTALSAVTAAWRSVTPATFRLIRSAMGDQLPPLGWPEYRAWALGSGIAVPRGGNELEVVPTVRAGQELDPTSRQAYRLLLNCWVAHPEPSFAADAVAWAIGLRAWAELSELWLGQLLPAGSWRDPEVIRLLSGLPPEARRKGPLLTIAWARARAQALGGSAGERQRQRDQLADATLLHARWREADGLDAMLLSASLWMNSQREVPGIDPTSALELAWDGQKEAALFLERRRAEATGFSGRAEAIFRASSAQISLARGDLERAVIEAERSAMLDPEISAAIADGVAALARELAGGRDVAAQPGRDRADLHHELPRGLSAADSRAAVLAEALRAIRTLDQEAAERAMAQLRTMPTGATLWPVVLFAESLQAALWGDPEWALAELDDARAQHSMGSVEQLEPLGRSLLQRARVTLLERLGATATARSAARELSPEWRALAEARCLIWAGDHDAARRVADEGIFDAGTWLGDRLALRAIRVGAQLLDPAAGESIRADAVQEVIAICLKRHSLLPVALLPVELRSRMIATYLSRAQSAVMSPVESVLLERLRAVSPLSSSAAPPVRLTRREKLLLPLLASADAVPDIAASLHVSPNTVRTQVVNLRKKFGAASRTELVRSARNAGLLQM
ncbi:regulatory LuxR family protein [Propionicimonas paludicola]|uniref:Regulatory LuxR family protein n=1 Tax=Propionicimonas paludicola TaxID=185243 RepID=A0A2A9CNG8_9ACTN|nr:helix-turn-helix transcriptional regulator [Propionicimonas paludicola]PFG15997.1 regulatory LuxR family protein [Propionicimonas paludicola]